MEIERSIDVKFKQRKMHDDLDIILGDIVKQKPEITYNNNRTYSTGKKAPDGIEIRFGATRPTAEVRELLKAHGFKFSEKQTMWYALDNAKSRELAKHFSDSEVDVDDTQYEKRNFWVRVKNIHEFDKLRDHTEFVVKSEPPKYFYTKSYLKKTFPSIHSLIREPGLSYKRYYNKVVDEGHSETSQPESSNITLLELEAEAELELLKMRVEIQRKKKKSLQGLGEFHVDENKLQRFRQKAWSVQERWEVLNYK